MDIGTFPLLSVIIFLPLIGAVAVAILPASSARPVALGFALVTFLLSLFLLVGYLPGRAGFQFTETYVWIPIFGIQYKVGADGLSVVLVVVSVLTWLHLHEAPQGAQAQEGAAISGPVLQSAPQPERRAILAAQQRRLNSVGWVDPARGIAHIPIDEAMALVAQRSASAAEAGR